MKVSPFLGIADGSGRQFLEIIALNVRTEIAYGRFSDGCTSVSLHTRYCSFLGQNWDWETEQSDNLLLLTIIRNGFPTIKMVTEAGLIGKIGLNSSGVGVCLNAIKAKGLDSSRIPVHLALRQILESTSARGAVEVLKSVGISSAAHFLIGDAETAIGLESTSSTIFELYPDSLGRVFHTNHLIGHHEGVVEPGWLPDSNTRLGRIQVLADQVMINPKKKSVALETFGKMFADEDNYPSSICRAEEGVSDCATLFSISMDLQNSKAVITLGRPSESSNIITCQF